MPRIRFQPCVAYCCETFPLFLHQDLSSANHLHETPSIWTISLFNSFLQLLLDHPLPSHSIRWSLFSCFSCPSLCVFPTYMASLSPITAFSCWDYVLIFVFSLVKNFDFLSCHVIPKTFLSIDPNATCNFLDLKLGFMFLSQLSGMIICLIIFFYAHIGKSQEDIHLFFMFYSS